MLDKNMMLEMADKIVRTSLKHGAEEAEAFVFDSKALTVGIERGQINKSNTIVDRGIGIRVQVKKSIGFAYTNIFDQKNIIDDTIKKALHAASASMPDQDWKGLPEKKAFVVPENLFNKEVAELNSDDLVKLSARMLDTAMEADKRIFPIEGGAGAASVSKAIANSNEISGFDQGTIMECSLASVAKEGTNVTPVCFEFNGKRNADVDPEWVGKESARLAITALKTKRVETKNYKLILTQFALQDLFYNTLINAVKADNVQRKQSALSEKIGEKVGSEKLTIHDDGLFPGGLRSATFDGEGYPQQKTTVIDKGKLQNFLYDNYTAKKADKKNTGNASRAGYLSTPHIEATNFRVIPGNSSTEDLMNEIDDGLIVYYLQGAHSSNPVSGEFSVVATPAWKIKKGEIKHCTRGVMLSGNIFELLKNIEVVANNERMMGQLIAPWVLVKNTKVIGK